MKKKNMTGVLQIKAHAHDNNEILSYHNNGFHDMIITLRIGTIAHHYKS